jgi:zinc D-Ala-D-Ala carboxypeptidase
MKYFTLNELCHSDTAEKKLIDNTPTDIIRMNLQALVEHILDPLRERYGKPIHISSGYRSKALNRAVSGASGSQHLYGQAADMDNGKVENRVLFNLVQSMKLPYDQLIFETKKNGSTWVHVSYSSRNRRMAFEIRK